MAVYGKSINDELVKVIKNERLVRKFERVIPHSRSKDQSCFVLYISLIAYLRFPYQSRFN
eukprot:UN16564